MFQSKILKITFKHLLRASLVFLSFFNNSIVTIMWGKIIKKRLLTINKYIYIYIGISKYSNPKFKKLLLNIYLGHPLVFLFCIL